jgi:1-acyl-sn-glycerol-3-phosphate acyltransferase
MAREAPQRDDRPADLEPLLLEVVRETCRDLHRGAAHRVDVALDRSLERDLGLDSLARVELLLRAQRRFGVDLGESALAGLETPRDLLEAVRRAPRAAPAVPPEAARAPPPEPVHGEPGAAKTLQEVLDWHVQRHPSRVQIILASDGGEQEITYGGLMLGAAAVAGRLQAKGLKPGQSVALMLPTGASYFHSYFGVLLAGGIPVPIYPPAHLSRIEEHVRRHARILANAQAASLLTVPEAMPAARLLEGLVPGLRHVLALDDGDGERLPFRRADARAADIAFIQYTSGSTGNPKGVVLTHANLLTNIRAIGHAARFTPRDVVVSWLPLYHDLGLIAAWLGSLYHGIPLVSLPPLVFLARPERWLWALHRHRGTVTAAPNFAYELCVKRIEDAAIAGVDLGSVRLCANGAEPVSPDTMERFIARFAPYGFRREAMTPVYGLAESTVALLAPALDRGPLVDRIDRAAFVRHRRAVPAGPDDATAMRFVGCGKPLPGHEVRIVDEAGNEVGERVEGRLEFRGPSATSGYFRNPEETKRLFRGDWLDSGDRAYVAEGELFITGRVKDIVIRGGRNIHPQELEEAVGALPGIRKGCVAVFGRADPESGTERLVVLAETREDDDAGRERLRDAVVRAVTDVLGEPPDEVLLAPPHTVPKTSSGKIRRAASRELLEAGLVGAPARAVWWQLVRLAFPVVLGILRAWLAAAGRSLQGARAWIAFWAIAPAVWLATAATPRPEWAWRLGHRAARAFLALAGIPLEVRGLANLPRAPAHLVVANHASYLDGLVLVAALPAPCRFVAKRELLGSLVPRVYLRRLGAEFVERFEAQQSVADATRLAAASREGTPLVFFPEGTFRRAPGLLPFHLGAFAVAAQAGVAVVPVAIRGTRSVLPEGQWVPRRQGIVVTVGEPLAAPAPVPDSFAAAVSLRDAARAAILANAGEADANRS